MYYLAMKLLKTRVLVYFSEGEYVAHALEFDIVGTGSSVTAAKKELKEAIISHIDFCHQKSINPLRLAPGRMLREWTKLQVRSFKDVYGEAEAPERVRSVDMMPVPNRVKSSRSYAMAGC